MGIGQQTNPWLEAARAIPAPKASEVQHMAPESPLPEDTVLDMASEQHRAVLVAAHGGAGATTWAHILGAVDGGTVDRWVSERESVDVPTVLVLRASVEGITAAKRILARYGVDAFASALVVAAAPGKLPRRITAELRILAGAVELIHAPWVPGLLLKRAAHAAFSDIPPKELTKLTKLTTMLTTQGITTQGETQ